MTIPRHDCLSRSSQDYEVETQMILLRTVTVALVAAGAIAGVSAITPAKADWHGHHRYYDGYRAGWGWGPPAYYYRPPPVYYAPPPPVYYGGPVVSFYP